MAPGKRRQKQTSFWVETSQLPARGHHPFYSRLNEILDRAKFDTYAERICRKCSGTTTGRSSIAPGMYFRCFLMGCVQGIGSNRRIAYRVSDSLSLREFLGMSLGEQTPALTVQPTNRRNAASVPATLSEAGCTVTKMAEQAAQADAVGPVETASEVGVERIWQTRATTASRPRRIWPMGACAR